MALPISWLPISFDVFLAWKLLQAGLPSFLSVKESAFLARFSSAPGCLTRLTVSLPVFQMSIRIISSWGTDAEQMFAKPPQDRHDRSLSRNDIAVM